MGPYCVAFFFFFLIYWKSFVVLHKFHHLITCDTRYTKMVHLSVFLATLSWKRIQRGLGKEMVGTDSQGTDVFQIGA